MEVILLLIKFNCIYYQPEESVFFLLRGKSPLISGINEPNADVMGKVVCLSMWIR